jgi:hypothetical protein
MTAAEIYQCAWLGGFPGFHEKDKLKGSLNEGADFPASQELVILFVSVIVGAARQVSLQKCDDR